jgi:hypothetical protein
MKKMATKEEAIGFVEEAINRHNQNPNIILTCKIKDGSASGNAPISRWCIFQTLWMHRLLNISENSDPYTYYN